MRNILIIGAGKSASYLIQYFLDKSKAENLEITIGDLEISNAKKWIGTIYICLGSGFSEMYFQCFTWPLYPKINKQFKSKWK